MVTMKRKRKKKGAGRKVTAKKKTCSLLVKNFSEALKWKLKEDAAAHRITLARHLEGIVGAYLGGKRKK